MPISKLHDLEGKFTAGKHTDHLESFRNLNNLKVSINAVSRVVLSFEILENLRSFRTC